MRTWTKTHVKNHPELYPEFANWLLHVGFRYIGMDGSEYILQLGDVFVALTKENKWRTFVGWDYEFSMPHTECKGVASRRELSQILKCVNGESFD